MPPSLYAVGMKRVVKRIIARREELGISQVGLSAELQLAGLNISGQALSNLERGLRHLALDELPYFALALRVDPNWLFEWEKFKSTK